MVAAAEPRYLDIITKYIINDDFVSISPNITEFNMKKLWGSTSHLQGSSHLFDNSLIVVNLRNTIYIMKCLYLLISYLFVNNLQFIYECTNTLFFKINKVILPLFSFLTHTCYSD